MEKNNLPIPEKHSIERAFEQIHRANSFIRVVTIFALIVMVVLLAYTLIRVNQLTTQYQEEAEQRGLYNRQLLEELNKGSQQTKYLICQVVTLSYEDSKPPKEITDICGPILKAGPDGETSFLDQGSDAATNSNSQPALGPLATENSNQNRQNNNPATAPPTTSQPPNGEGGVKPIE